MASYDNKQVGEFDPVAEAWVATYPVSQNPIGLGIDPEGKVWAVGYGNPGRATRVDPATGDRVDSAPLGNQPYSYSDMTGYQLTQLSAQNGTWTMTIDSGVPGQVWDDIRWNEDTTSCDPLGCVPPGSFLRVDTRAYDGASPSGTLAEAQSGDSLDDHAGQYLEVVVSLRQTTAAGAPPRVVDLTVRAQEVAVVSSVRPDQVPVGYEGDIALTGAYFSTDMAVDLGEHVDVLAVEAADANHATVTIRVRPTQPPAEVPIGLDAGDGPYFTAQLDVYLDAPTLTAAAPTYVSPGQVVTAEFEGENLVPYGTLSPTAGTTDGAIASGPDAATASVQYTAPPTPAVVHWTFSTPAGSASLTGGTIVHGVTAATSDPIGVGTVGTLVLEGVGLDAVDEVVLPAPFEVIDTAILGGDLVASVRVPDQPVLVGSHDVTVQRPGTTLTHTIPGGLVVVARPPALIAVTPQEAGAGAQFSMIVTGENLLGDSTWDFGPGISAATMEWRSEEEVVLAVFVGPTQEPGPRDLTVATVYGESTLPAALTIAPYALTSIAPSELEIGDATTLTLTGVGFETGMTLDLGQGVTVGPVTTLADDTATVPVAAELDAPVGLRTAQLDRNGTMATLQNGIRVIWSQPTVTSITPSVVQTGEAATFQVTGTGFGPADTVTLGPYAPTVQSELTDDSLWTVVVSMPQTPGSFDVKIANPGRNDALAGAVESFGVTSLEPSEWEQGQTTSVAFQGFGFGDDLALDWGPGISLDQLEIQDSQNATAEVTVAEDAAFGERPLESSRADGALRHTLDDAVSVSAPDGAPTPSLTLVSCSPASSVAGVSVSVTCAGTGFRTESTVSFGSGIEVTDLVITSAQSLRAQIDIGGFATAGPRTVKIIQTTGSASLVGGFEVLSAPLSLTAVQPEPVWLKGSEPSFYLIGSGFTAGTQVSTEVGVGVSSYEVISQKKIQVRGVMYGSPGQYDVSASNGSSSATLADSITIFGLVTVTPATISVGQTRSLVATGGLPVGTVLSDATGGLDITTTGATGTSLAASVTATTATPLGPHDLKITLGTRSHVLPGAITVLAGAPEIDSVQPNAMETAQTHPIAIHGANLVSCTPTVTGAAQLVDWVETSPYEATLTLQSGTAAGTVSLQLSCAGGSGSFVGIVTVWEGSQVPEVPVGAAGGIDITSPTHNAPVPWNAGGASVTAQFALTDFALGTDGTAHFFRNGVEVGFVSSGAAYVFQGLPTGRHHLTAQLFDPQGVPLPGGKARDTVVVRVAGPCSTTADCEDSNVCSEQKCSNGACAYGPSIVSDGVTCCLADIECGAGFACVDNTCRQCSEDVECIDGVPCTLNSCNDWGQCELVNVGGCCQADIHCNDKRFCTTDICNNGTCEYQTAANCCDTAAECDDSNACTNDGCSNNKCVHSKWLGGCCFVDADCDDGVVCTADTCNVNTQQCSFQKIPSDECCEPGDPNCCNSDLECIDDNYCTIDTCDLTNRQCAHARVPIAENPFCCVSEIDCDDGVPCNIDRCQRGDCRYGPDPAFSDKKVRAYNTCCVADPASLPHYTPYLGCNDLNACTVDWCDGPTFTCHHEALDDPDCCNVAADCDDGDPYTLDVCIDNQCDHVADPNYCATNADCDDGYPCSTDACVGSGCVHTKIEGCCVASKQCADGNPCTIDQCDRMTHTCTVEVVPACCSSAASCNDGSACTLDACINGKCRSFAVPNCCEGASDCTAAPACATATCVANKCQYSATAGTGCCLSVADCDDANPCTVDACSASSQCTHAPIARCCTTAANCDDGDPCTTNTCADGTCKSTGKAGCCNQASDCDDGDDCSVDSCVGGSCQHTLSAACTVPLPLVVEMADPAYEFGPPDGWIGYVDDMPGADWYWMDRALRVLPPAGHNGSPFDAWIVSPVFRANGVFSLSAQLEIGPLDAAEKDEWEMYESADAGATWKKMNHYADGDSPVRTFVFLAALGSPQARVAVRLKANATQDVGYLTRIAIGKGRPPLWLEPMGGTQAAFTYLPFGGAKPLPIRAFDPDFGVVTFSLMGVPAGVYVQSYGMSTIGFSAEITAYGLTAATLGSYAPWVVANDGLFRSARSIQTVPASARAGTGGGP